MGVWAMLGLMLRGAMGTLGEASTVQSFRFQRILVQPGRVWARGSIKVAFDGEVGRMRAPLEFRVAPRPLYLLKPEAIAGADGSGVAAG